MRPNTSGFTYESIIFLSDRVATPIELKGSVTDLTINEHIEKPWLTGSIALKDDEGFLQHVDVLGAERISVTLQSNDKGSRSFTKVFYIDKILANNRINDRSQIIIFHLIEDVGYNANLININRSYTGKCSEIIQKISSNYLAKQIVSTGNDRQNVKVIVPNMSPIEAMSWLKNRASTIDGYPFYLFSSIASESLIMADLGTLVSRPTVNTHPFRHFQSGTLSPDPTVRQNVIMEYSQESAEDLFTLIAKGLIGAEYEYIDTIENKRNTFHFDIMKDLLDPLIAKGVLGRNSSPLYSPLFRINGKGFHTLDSKRITRIGGSSAFDQAENKSSSYLESEQLSDYKLNVISDAMVDILKKSPMEIAVDGREFISGTPIGAVGNNISVEFLGASAGKGGPIYDQKKSGDYLVFAAKHMFKRERYDVRLSCVKLGNMKNVYSR